MTPTRRKTFGANGFGAIAGTQSLGKPAAVYPGAVATDSDMMIAVDRQQTRLALPMNSADTSMTVVDPSMIVPYCLLTIDSETVKVTGPAVGNVIPVSRGFDGTTAAVHLASAVVSGFVDAYHHNRLVAEVEAIEQTLGANLSRIPASPFLVSSTYNFPCQTPGGNLVAGNNSINMAPVPLGVNGSDQHHYLYVTGGAGTAEPVLITGGSAVSGAPSGTLIVNCANTHSGAWTICSATAGIQEALNSLGPTGGIVMIPAGTQNVQGPISMSKNAQWLIGQGPYATVLNATYTAGPIIDTTAAAPPGSGNGLRGFSISGSGGSNYGVLINDQNTFVISEVVISSTGGGIRGIGPDTFRILIDAVNVSNHTGNAFSIEDGGDWILTRCFADGANGSNTVGINVVQCGGLDIVDGDFILNNVGMSINPGNGQKAQWAWITDTKFDTSIYSGINISASGTGQVNGFNFVNCWTATSSGSGGIGDHGSGVTIGSGAGVDGIRFLAHRFVNNNTSGLAIFGGSHITVGGGSLFAGNGKVAGGGPAGLSIFAGSGVVMIRDSFFGQSDGFANTQAYGIAINSAPIDNVIIENNTFGTNVSGTIQNAGTGTHNVIRNNQGYNPVGQFPITVTASPFVYTAGTSPEIIYIRGGTVSDIKVGSTSVASASPAQIILAPNSSLTVTYSAAPTMVKDIQ